MSRKPMSERKIDALVAEKVFGCRTDWDCGFCVDGIDHEIHGDKRPWCNCEKEKHYSNSEGLDTLFYSSDISAAWAVVEKMRESEFSIFGISIDGTDEYSCGFGKTWPCQSEGFSKSAPMAICLAALKAVGVEVPV